MPSNVSETKVEEIVEEVIIDKPSKDQIDLATTKPDETQEEVKPTLEGEVVDVSVKKRKIKTKKRDSVTEQEVMPSDVSETKVEEIVEEVIIDKPSKDQIDLATTKPDETQEEVKPTLEGEVVDVSVKKRKIKTKKRD